MRVTAYYNARCNGSLKIPRAVSEEIAAIGTAQRGSPQVQTLSRIETRETAPLNVAAQDAPHRLTHVEEVDLAVLAQGCGLQRQQQACHYREIKESLSEVPLAIAKRRRNVHKQLRGQGKHPLKDVAHSVRAIFVGDLIAQHAT